MVERFQTLIPMFRADERAGVPRADHRERRDRHVPGRRGARRCEAQDAGPAASSWRRSSRSRARRASCARARRSTQPGEFGTSFFTIVDGEVTLEGAAPPHIRTRLGRGEFFGEMSLLSGRPRSEKAIAGPGLHPGRDAAPDDGQADELQRGGSQRHRLDFRRARAAAAFRAVRDAARPARHRGPRDVAALQGRRSAVQGRRSRRLAVRAALRRRHAVAQAGRRADSGRRRFAPASWSARWR